MADPEDVDVTIEDDYDEEADSDFESHAISDGKGSSSSDEATESNTIAKKSRKTSGRGNRSKAKAEPETIELDSGDEATLLERKKAKAKEKRKGGRNVDDSDDGESHGWRARTRAMRQNDQERTAKSRLASLKESTVDVDELWKAMNSPGGLDTLKAPDMKTSIETSLDLGPNHASSPLQPPEPKDEVLDQGRETLNATEETITIDETYEFAGEIHKRKKTVPKSSAEAKLWLTTRGVSQNTDPRFPGNDPIRRPLRKISRFDPNLNNLDPFNKTWKQGKDEKPQKAQKLNAVEKSKMDWAAHVDEEGLQDELAEQAKAKGAYMGKAEFLRQVEHKQDEEARRLRQKGRS